MPKTVHFFRLDMEKEVKNKQEFEPIKKIEEKQSKYEVLDGKIKNSGNILVISPEKRQEATLEITLREGSYIFGKLCKKQDVSNYQIRQVDTLVANRVVIEANQVLEKFSYFLMDTSNFAVSYIKESSAPTIHYLADAVSIEYSQSKPVVRGKMNALLAEDAIEILSKKDIIGTIKYDMTIPTGLPMEITGLNTEEYLALQNMRGIKIQVQLQAQKRKKSTIKPGKIGEFLQSLSKGKDKVTVNAKDNDENYIMPYLLENNPFVKKAKFEDIDVGSIEEFDKEVFKKLKSTYESNKAEIVDYLGF